MKYLNIMFIFVVTMFVVSVSPVFADDPFGDLISGTKIYFSHVATQNGWETEIAVINPTSEAASGTMISYSDSGRQVGDPISIDLPAHGRYQAEVGTAFANPETIAYIVLTSEVFGLKGYTKFHMGGMRASIMASGPRTTGLFTKIDHEGWTGIAFINTASAATANITLTAYDNNGEVVAEETMQVVSGEKVVDPVEKIFTDSVESATYVSYTSDHGVVGFFLNGFGDGSGAGDVLDGSQAL
ncbi:MAG: hypothetical protein U9N63_01435 [Pseudomonadota bacterium]|nr:hypothetical protein [Pseudomonadota bacterium]